MTTEVNPCGIRPDCAHTSRIVRDLQAHGLLELAREVAAKFHVTTVELLGRGRGRPEVRARRELWARAHSLIPSFTRLSEIFDRDRSCIRAALRTHAGQQGRPTRCRTVPRLNPCRGLFAKATAAHPAQATMCDPLPETEA